MKSLIFKMIQPYLVSIGRTLVCLVVGIFCSLVFFRQFWISGFDRIAGDNGDASLIISFLEHWVKVLTVGIEWMSPSFFYPLKGVLGLSDAFMLYAIVYVPLRMFDLDPYLCFQATLISVHSLGFFSFMALSRYGLKLKFIPSLLGVTCPQFMYQPQC
ncbi:MAG: hypothetical protein HQK82_09185 [Desulfovibrionaceae bacterium]|nr:hypothetical protein [Desulfovibrionaceae bacterium]